MFGQGDFSAGLWRGKKAPQSAFYDCSNGLIDDEGNLARRGASAYKSNANAGDTLVGLFDGYLAGGLRTLMWAKSPASGSLVYRLGSDDATPAGLTTTTLQIDPLARGAVANDILFLPCAGSTGAHFAWAGSRKTTDQFDAPSVTFTEGATAITASGTSWLSKYEPGAIVAVIVGETYWFAVQSVDSDTQMTLTTPWPLATGSHTVAVANFFNLPWTLPDPPRLVAAAGSQPRVWSVRGARRVYYSEPAPVGPGTYINNYIDLPAASYITGIDGIQDSLVLFTTEGVWTVTNTDLDPVDDAGQLQWQQQEVTRDVILWGDPGIAAWEGELLVPAIDDVYVLSLDGSAKPISEGIRPLYRSYVAAGYSPGLARVYRGHYFLSVVNGTTWVDTLVCRLDRPTQTPSGRVIYPWTRWAGHAASIAYAQRVGSTTRTPKLLGLAGQRVTDLTATLDGQGAADADGTDIAFTWTPNDVPLANGTAAKLRGRYELVEPNTDIFNRPDETGLSNGWLAWTSDLPDISAGAAVPPASTFGSTSRPESIGPDSFCQAVYTEPMDPALNNVGVAVRLTAHSGSANGYSAGFASSGHLHLWKGSGFTQIASSSGTYTSVEGIRIVATGSTIEGYVLQSGSWALAVSVTDATYGSAGFPGFWVASPASGTVIGASRVSWGAGIEPDSSCVTVEYSSDQDGGVFTELAGKGEQGGGTGWGVSDGSKYQWANVNKKRDRIRFRFTLSGSATSLVWRAIELLTRASGKQ